MDGVLISFTEATEKVRAEQALRVSEKRLATAVEAIGGGVFEYVVPGGGDLYLSRRWCEILGSKPEDLPRWEDFEAWYGSRVHQHDKPLRDAALSDFVEGRSAQYEIETRLCRADGEWLWVREYAQAVERDKSGRVTRLSGLMLDVTDRKMAEDRAEHLARHDPLTELPNRMLFEERLAAAMEESDDSGAKTGLVLVDLDGFKRVNDKLGHLAGDRLLRVVARRLRLTVRGRDTPSRFGGDEFAVVLPGIRKAEDARAAATRICDAVLYLVSLGNLTIQVGPASVPPFTPMTQATGNS